MVLYLLLVNRELQWDISTVREVTIEGEGRATVALVDKTLKIKQELERKNAMSFDRVWVVFDKDDFDDFNDAIKKAYTQEDGR